MLDNSLFTQDVPVGMKANAVVFINLKKVLSYNEMIPLYFLAKGAMAVFSRIIGFHRLFKSLLMVCFFCTSLKRPGKLGDYVAEVCGRWSEAQ